MGFGFGASFTTLTIMVQESVGYDKRGAAMASNSLIRTLGQTIGVSIFGSLFNLNIIRYFNNIGIKGIAPNNLYSSKMPRSEMYYRQVKESLNSSLHIVFIGMIVISALCVVLSFTLKSKLKKQFG
jgi:MFS family permease